MGRMYIETPYIIINSRVINRHIGPMYIETRCIFDDRKINFVRQ